MVSEIAGERKSQGRRRGRKILQYVCIIECTSGGSERCGSGGYFAFVTNDKMSIFHYSTEFGVAFTPVEPEDVWHFTMGEQ